MHYIRFLKPPRLLADTNTSTSTHSPRTLTSKLTITTDLGESFLATDVVLRIDLEDVSSGRSVGSKEYQWKGSLGMRALEVVVPCHPSVKAAVVKMVVTPKEEGFAVGRFERVFEFGDGDGDGNDDEEERGGIVGVKSMPISLSVKKKSAVATATTNTAAVGMAERVFSSSRVAGGTAAGVDVQIWEETGESIARHIWDAGLVLSAYLARLCNTREHENEKENTEKKISQLPRLQECLQTQNLKVLELGAGCGIVGLTLASHHASIEKLIMTDLPEASEILTQNLTHSPFCSTSTDTKPTKPTTTTTTTKRKRQSPKVTQQILDWSASPLPPNIRATKWDLILVADCTYNPDVVPDLVRTLGLVVGCGRGGGQCEDENESDGGGALVCLAMKVRHESEKVFFVLMEEAGFVVQEKCRVPLPVLGGEGEEIEIFVFTFLGQVG